MSHLVEKVVNPREMPEIPSKAANRAATSQTGYENKKYSIQTKLIDCHISLKEYEDTFTN